MPIYEYVCKSCDHEFEALQKMSDDPLKECPECKALSLTKKISAAGFRLSGGGWYETDFKSGNKKNLASSGDSDKPKSSGSGSSETKASGGEKKSSKPASA